MQSYQFDNFQLRYPADWELLEEEHEEGEISLTIQNDETAFWILSLYLESPEPDSLIETAADLIREEYDEVEVSAISSLICGQEAVACNVEFVYLDLISRACFQSFRIGNLTALIYSQDVETAENQSFELFNQITDSLQYTG